MNHITIISMIMILLTILSGKFNKDAYNNHIYGYDALNSCF